MFWKTCFAFWDVSSTSEFVMNLTPHIFSRSNLRVLRLVKNYTKHVATGMKP
eukprot:UN00691